MDTCTECKTGSLSSAFEKRLMVCSDCASTLVASAKILRQEVVQLAEAKDALTKLVNAFDQANEAEKAGHEASCKGFSDDQNPHTEPALKLFWDSGWARGELERRTGQISAVMKWAVMNLDAIEDLAKGYGQQEIADKLSIVAEKLADFVEVA